MNNKKSDTNIVCPHCNNSIFHKQNNKLKVRTNIIIFEKGVDGTDFSTEIKCNSCKKFIKVPIKLDFSDLKMKHIILEN